MNQIQLIEPTEEYAEQIWQFRQEILDSNDNDKFAGCGNLRTCTSAEEWIATARLQKSAQTCPEGHVPSNNYIAVRKEDNRIVGAIDLRHHINHPILSTWGGHTGFYVRLNERHKGYAKEMLRQNLLNCKALHIEKVLITCDADNTASEKTIIANGGIFEKEIEVHGDMIKRFWISIP